MEKKRVAIQGILGSFHEEAAHKFFGDNITPVECDTFRGLCEKLENQKADVGIMAIENSIAGSMLQNYALLREYHFKIIGEVYLHIHMNLLAYPGVALREIEFINSHPIAIRQCSDFIQSLPDVKILVKNDTAEAAKEIKNREIKNAGAIASRSAAEIYGLDVLEKSIETNKKNYTRFLILSTQGIEDPRNNKASICFETGHQPGALAEVLNIFARNAINLTKIQSVPILGKPYEYSFHADVSWGKTQDYERAIHSVLKNVSNLSILGEYPKGEMHQNGEIDRWVNV